MHRRTLARALTAVTLSASLAAAPSLAQARPAAARADGGGTIEWSLSDAMAHANGYSNPIPDTRGNAGVWGFYGGSADDPSASYLLSDKHFDNCGAPGFYSFTAPRADVPLVGYNASDQTADCGTPKVPAHEPVLHPSGTDDAIVAWKAPVSGELGFSAQVVDDDPHGGNGVSYALDLAGRPLSSTAIDDGGAFSESFSPDNGVHVEAGQYLFLRIGARDGDNRFDSTQVDLSVYVTPDESAEPPTLTRVAPHKWYPGYSGRLTLTGTGFTEDSVAALDPAIPGVTLGRPSRPDDSGTTLQVPVEVAPGTELGSSTVVVSDPDSEGSATCGSPRACAFRVVPLPAVSDIAPSAVTKGASSFVELTGDGFATNLVVKVSGPGLTVSDVRVADPQHATFTLAAAADAKTGDRTLIVSDPGAGRSTYRKAIAVRPAPAR